jgi:arginase
MTAAARTKAVTIIGVPMDLGASRRGVDMGPSAIRIAGLAERLRRLGIDVDDGRNVAVPGREELPQTADQGAAVPSPHFIESITAVCAQLADETARAARAGRLPIVLGGDHSLAAGSVAGVASSLAEHGERLGLVWFDAHSDIHLPTTSGSGNVHGMPIAHLLGLGDPGLSSIGSARPAVHAENVVLVGLRDVDPPERDHIRELGVRAFTMKDIDERGVAAVVREAIEIAGRGTGGIHVSLDMDFIDPIEAPGVGTPVRGGVTFREAHLAMEMISESGRMLGLDVVEVNPVLDHHNLTAELAVDLVASALGQRIL